MSDFWDWLLFLYVVGALAALIVSILFYQDEKALAGRKGHVNGDTMTTARNVLLFWAWPVLVARIVVRWSIQLVKDATGGQG